MRNPPPFDSREFLNLARLLSGAGIDEAKARTAIGRAYYALFLIARDRLLVTGRYDVHGRVIETLRLRNRAWGDQLDKLRRLRTIADYELMPNNPGRRDWQRNWNDAEALAGHLLSIVQTL